MLYGLHVLFCFGYGLVRKATLVVSLIHYLACLFGFGGR